MILITTLHVVLYGTIHGLDFDSDTIIGINSYSLILCCLVLVVLFMKQ